MRLDRRYCGWALGVLLLLAGQVQADQTDEEVARLVQALGYGGAIHNFKNYLLRGDVREEYGDKARAQFSLALRIIERLEGDPAVADKQGALVDIRRTVEAYVEGLGRIKQLFEKGWRLEDIDRAVSVDDRPAIAALNSLHASRRWGPVATIEYRLGFGGAIHHFKNYVLRGGEAYHTQALESFLEVDSLMAEALSQDDLSDRERADLMALGRVTHAYMEYLSLVERLIRMQRPIRQIDLAVKVNDQPALEALKNLRAGPVTGR